MNRLTYALTVAGMFCSMSAFAEEVKTYPGPHEAAPNVYKQLLDNERVRVSEIKFNQGDKAAMHTHAYPHVVYVIEAGELTITQPDGTSVVMQPKVGDTVWMEAETHEAVNTGTTVFRATVTEIK